jgi:hypothetical protein
MKYKLMALLGALILLLAPATACTGYIDLAGHVYAWTNAPAGASSLILYVETVPYEYQVTPLKNATVVFEDKDKSHRFNAESKEDGYFQLGTTFEMDEYLNIDATYSGYKPAHGRLDVLEDKSFYSFVVLMVPSGN